MGCCQLSSRTPSDTSVPPSPTSGGLRCLLSIRQESALGSPPWVRYHEKPRDKCQKEKEKTRKYQKELGQDSWSDAKSPQKWRQQSGLGPAPTPRPAGSPVLAPRGGAGKQHPRPPRLLTTSLHSAHSVLGTMHSDSGHEKIMGGSLNFRTDINNLS